MKTKNIIVATLFILATCISQTVKSADTDCGASSPCVLARSLVFAGGDGVSKFYRIPALTVAPDGTIIAVADHRLDSNKDLPGRIDVVCRRSSDNGATWGPSIDIALNDSVGGFGDPALGVNEKGELIVVMTHGNGLWESTPDNHSSIWTSHSSDNGATWSEPTDVTSRLFGTEYNSPVKAVTAFATSGHIETLRDGSMMFCLVSRPKEKKWSELQIYPVLSTDGGMTWKSIPVSVHDDADESKIVQCSDNSLLMSIRNRRKGYRKFSRSNDGGMSWTPVALSTTLPDPACNGDLISYNYDDKNYLLHSIPDSHRERKDVSIYASADNGETWRKLITVCPGGSAYSALAELPDGTIGCLTEEDNPEGGFQIWFNKIDIRRLLDKQFAE